MFIRLAFRSRSSRGHEAQLPRESSHRKRDSRPAVSSAFHRVAAPFTSVPTLFNYIAVHFNRRSVPFTANPAGFVGVSVPLAARSDRFHPVCVPFTAGSVHRRSIAAPFEAGWQHTAASICNAAWQGGVEVQKSNRAMSGHAAFPACVHFVHPIQATRLMPGSIPQLPDPFEGVRLFDGRAGDWREAGPTDRDNAEHWAKPDRAGAARESTR